MEQELVLDEASNAVQIFTGGGLSAILDGIEAKVRALPLDGSTAAGRDEIRSVAYRVVRSKTLLDSEGKRLTEEWRKNTALVNAERKRSSERLDALAEEVRKPLTDFENKEKIRQAAHEEAIVDLSSMLERVAGQSSLPTLRTWLVDAERAQAGRDWEDWEEYATRATRIKGELLAALTTRIAECEKFEAAQDELDRMRKAEQEREQKERDERIRAEAADRARLAAERKAKEEADAEARRVIEAAETERKRVSAEAARVQQEHERVRRESEAREANERAERLAAEQRATAAEAARVAQEKKAEAERLAAEVRAASELKATKERAAKEAEVAAQREREKMAAEQRAQEAEQAKREANAKLRARIQREIADDFSSLGNDIAAKAANLLMAGRVRHCKVIF